MNLMKQYVRQSDTTKIWSHRYRKTDKHSNVGRLMKIWDIYWKNGTFNEKMGHKLYLMKKYDC